MHNEKEASPRPEESGLEVYNEGGLHPAYQHEPPIAIWSGHNEKTEQAVPRRKTVCGLSRKLLLLMTGFALLVLALAAGLGAGLGIGLRGSSNIVTNAGSSAAAAVTTSSIAASSSTSIASSTSSTTSTSSTSTTSTSSPTGAVRASACPKANGTTINQDTINFIVYCDVEVSAPYKYNERMRVLPSFASCLDECATIDKNENRTDISAVYNWSGNGNQAPGSCWCVGNTGPNNLSVTVNTYIGNDLGLVQS